MKDDIMINKGHVAYRNFWNRVWVSTNLDIEFNVKGLAWDVKNKNIALWKLKN